MSKKITQMNGQAKKSQNPTSRTGCISRIQIQNHRVRRLPDHLMLHLQDFQMKIKRESLKEFHPKKVMYLVFLFFIKVSA